MELHQIRYFLALARTLNFTRAAEACQVTQPALTKAIQKLEDEVGGALLYRERSLTRLTDLGTVMLPFLEQTLIAADAARTAAAGFHQRDLPPLRLAMEPAIPVSVLAPVMRELESRLNGFTLELQVAAAEAIVEGLLAGDGDAGLLDGSARLPDRLRSWPLFSDAGVVLCPVEHRFAGLAEVPVSALGGESWIVRRGSCDLEAAVDVALAPLGQRRFVRHAAAGEDQLQQLVAAGFGVAVGTARQPILPGLAARPIVDPALPRPVVLVTVAGRPYSPTLGAFVNLARARSWTP